MPFLFCKKSLPKGFTLVELVVAVAIVGILVSIAIPEFSKMRRNSRISELKSQLSSFHTANESFKTNWSTYFWDWRDLGFGVTGSQRWAFESLSGPAFVMNDMGSYNVLGGFCNASPCSSLVNQNTPYVRRSIDYCARWSWGAPAVPGPGNCTVEESGGLSISGTAGALGIACPGVSRDTYKICAAGDFNMQGMLSLPLTSKEYVMGSIDHEKRIVIEYQSP